MYREKWVFSKNPKGEVKVVHNQEGDYSLKLGQYAIDSDIELVPGRVGPRERSAGQNDQSGPGSNGGFQEIASLNNFVLHHFFSYVVVLVVRSETRKTKFTY